MKSRAFLGLALATVLSGCGAAQTLNDAIGAVLAPPNSQMAGEVVSVDTRNQQIRIRTPDNQTGWVHYDGNTKVLYQQQEYTVASLEPGDVVSITLQSTGGTTQQQLHATEITVTQSAQDRTGTPTTGGTTSTSGAQRLEGNVGVIDTTRGTFELRSG